MSPRSAWQQAVEADRLVIDRQPVGFAASDSAEGDEPIGPGDVVIDLVTGVPGRVESVYGDGSAHVVFPGGVGRMIQPWEMSIAEDQTWPPGGGL